MRSTFRIIALAAAIGVLSAPITAMEFDLVDRCAPKPSARTRRDDPFLPFAPPTRARLTTSSPRPPLAGATARVPEDNMKCVLEEPNVHAGHVHVRVPGRHARQPEAVQSSRQEIPAQTDSARGSAGFTTELEGDYRACFYKTDVDKEDLANHKVRLDWKTGIAVADWEKIAKADKVDSISSTLRSLEAEMREIHNGMLFLRQKEAELRDLNEATNTRVAWLSICSLAVCIGLCVWQIIYLKQFFQRKKLL